MHSSSDPLIQVPPSNGAIVSGINKLPDAPEVEGVNLAQLPIGAVLEIETGHTTYHMENKGEGQVLLSGHPKYCPEPTAVLIQGSLNPDCGLKWHFLGLGMKMVFLPPEHGVVRTSSIKALRQVQPRGSN